MCRESVFEEGVCNGAGAAAEFPTVKRNSVVVRKGVCERDKGGSLEEFPAEEKEDVVD